MSSILVVVDMQNDFIDGSLGTKEAKDIVGNVVDKIKGFDGKIFATLDTHDDNYLETFEGKHLPVAHCIRMTNGWVLNKDVRDVLVGKDYKIIEKRTFGSTRLINEIRRILDRKERLEIEIVGLCTDICVVSNALLLKASFPDIEISVDVDCCAGTSPDAHKAALLTMKMCQIHVNKKTVWEELG